MANKIVKVYSFGRSGTHWFMSLLKNRFYGSVFTGSTIGQGQHSFHGWNDNKCLWHDLLGGHWHQPQNAPTLENAIYLIRDGRDVMVSMWLMGKSLNESLTLSELMAMEGSSDDPQNPHPKLRNATRWRWSTTLWKQSGMPIVSYEDLMQDKDKVLDKVAEEFSLEDDRMDKSDTLVGFHPSIPRIGKWAEYFADNDMKLFMECQREADLMLFDAI